MEQSAKEKKKWSSRKKEVIAYTVVLAVCYAAFWCFPANGAMAYSLLVQFLALPVAGFVVALLMGLDNSWKERQWWLLLYFGFGFFLMQEGTFGLAAALSRGWFSLPQQGLFTTGIALALPGMVLGSVIRWGRELAAHPQGLSRVWLAYGLVWGICTALPYLTGNLSLLTLVLFLIPDSAFPFVRQGIQVLFLAGPCVVAQLAALFTGIFLGKSSEWKREMKYLPVFGAASLLSVGMGGSFLPWDIFSWNLSPQLAVLFQLASFLGGMVPPLVGGLLAKGMLAAGKKGKTSY